MLFEQAGVDGSQVRRPEGTVMTFRETVHHQFIGSISNLLTIARGRRELLSDYYGVKLQNVRGDGDKGAAFLFPPGPNTDRIEQLAGKLVDQNIEVETATSSFKVGRLRSSMGENVRNKRFPRGTLIVRTRQPLKQLVEVILDFDIRIPTSFLETEKKEILKHGGTRLYDATAWSLPLAYDVEAYYTTSLPHVGTSPYTTPSRRTGHLSGEETTVGFAFDCSGDRSYHLLARLFERGYKVWCARKPFESAGRLFPRGSFVIRLSGNPHLDVEELRRLSEETGVDVYGAGSGWGGAHADLGGNELGLLAAPRIAIVGGYPTSSYTFGSVWHLLDNQFRMRCSTIDAARIARSDLDKYNAVVLPDAWGGAALLKRVVGDAGIKRLGEWVEDGGTLIAMGNGAAMLADTSVGLTSVRLRRQSLSKLRSYDLALSAEREAESPAVDSLDVWEGKEEAPNEVSHAKTDKAILEAKDAEARMLHPRGAMLSVNADTEHWLTAGCGARVPVLLTGDYAYLAKRPVAVVGRFSDASRLRIAGLCWPEARDRWAQTAYLTREARGKGQVILFASQPNFRGYFLGSERLLLNAMLLGPGMGTRRAIEW
jgi:hypothetical protein